MVSFKLFYYYFNKCFNISSALYKKHILDKNDVDVFVHSWSTGMQDHILGAYEPKKYLIEEQKVFSVPKWVPGVKARKQTHAHRAVRKPALLAAYLSWASGSHLWPMLLIVGVPNVRQILV